MNRRILSAAGSLAALACASIAHQAFAQTGSTGPASGEKGGAADQGLADIVVTARRVAENLQDIPVAITAYSGEALIQQNVRALPDVAALTPGLTIVSGQTSPGAIVFQMRGQVQIDSLATLDPSVGTYVDGVYWARSYGMNASMVDIANFQALKGPQGTLFGRNTSGGAILLTTNDPSFNEGLSGSISATYGRFNQQSLTAILNAPLVDDKLAVRLVYSGNRRDGYVTEVNSGRKVQNLDDYTVRAKVLFTPTDTFRVIVAGERFKSDTENDVGRLHYFRPSGLAALEGGLEQLGPAACLTDQLACLAVGNQKLANDVAAGASRYRTSLTTVPRFKIATQTYSVTGTVDTSFGEIRAIGAYRQLKSTSYDTENDGSSLRLLDGDGLEAKQNIKQWSGEVTATGKALNDRLDFAVGGLWFHEYGVDGTPASSVTELAKLSTGGIRAITFSNGRVDTKAWGIYSQATYHINEQLSLTGGLRYSSDKKGLDSNNATILGSSIDDPNRIFICAIGPVCPQFRSATFKAWSYTASIDYKPNEDLLLYLKTAKGFRAGGQALRAVAAIPASLQPFKPEIVYNYEAGVKAELFDRKLRTNLAVYYTKAKDLQRNTTVFNPVVQQTSTLTENAASANTWGFEFDGSVLLGGGFRLDGTAAYTKSKYKKFIDSTGFDRSHEPFVLTPRWTASLSPVWEGEASFGRVNARMDFAYQSRQDLYIFDYYKDASGVLRDATNGLPYTLVDAQGFKRANTDVKHIVVNARVGVTVLDGKLDLAVWGKNITNLKDTVTALVIPQLDFGRSLIREPRTYGVTATAKF
jgi:iron complex outermembrane receptor protein